MGRPVTPRLRVLLVRRPYYRLLEWIGATVVSVAAVAYVRGELPDEFIESVALWVVRNGYRVEVDP